MFSAYALRVIMFGPHASPVVNAHMTWHIGPMTCVSTSRRRANVEIQSSPRSDSQRRISATCASRKRASCTASSVDLQTKQDALVIRSWSTYVRKPPDSAAARAPRYSDAERPPSVCASGTNTSSEERPVSETRPKGSSSSYSPSSICKGPTTDTGMTAAPVSISCAATNGERSIFVTPSVSPSALWRASIDSGSFFRGQRFISTSRAYAAPDTHNPPHMATDQLIEITTDGREAYAGVLRFYALAKRQEWQVRELPWRELPPIPEGKGSPQ